MLREARTKTGSNGEDLHQACCAALPRAESFTQEQWHHMWSRHQGGTAPGPSELSTTIMKALQTPIPHPDNPLATDTPVLWISDLVRRWCNLVFEFNSFP